MLQRYKGEIIIPLLSKKPFENHASYLRISLESFPLWSMALPIVSLSTSPSRILASFGDGLNDPKEGFRTPLPLSSCMSSVPLTSPPLHLHRPHPKPFPPSLQSLTIASENFPSYHTCSLISSRLPTPWSHYVLWIHLHSNKTVHHNSSFKSLC